MSELHVFNKLDSKSKLETALRVVSFSISHEAEKGIVPVSVEEIMLTERALVATMSGEFAGYIRLKEKVVHERSHHNYQSVGTLVVEEPYRGNGIGTELVKGITQDALDEATTPFAHCNSFSLKSFQSAGYEVALPGELPALAISRYDNQSVVYRI